jgi:hypothetical protein
MPPKKRLAPDAEQIACYLTPEEQLAIDVLRARRKKRGQERTSASEIIADSLWLALQKEGVSRQQIQSMMPSVPGHTSKVQTFPKRD